MAGFSVTVEMDQGTVETLVRGGYTLYGFKAVRSAAGGGQPVVWFETTGYLLTTRVQWEERYQAYVSRSPVVDGGQIQASSRYDVQLDQTLEVLGSFGTGTVVPSGVPGAISITNQTDREFTCGISQQSIDDTFVPVCAFPLGSRMTLVIAPAEKVFLMFSTTAVDAGAVLFQADAAGILIDLAGTSERTVRFSSETGWSWDQNPWARTCPPHTDLAPLLIESPAG